MNDRNNKGLTALQLLMFEEMVGMDSRFLGIRRVSNVVSHCLDQKRRKAEVRCLLAGVVGQEEAAAQLKEVRSMGLGSREAVMASLRDV